MKKKLLVLLIAVIPMLIPNLASAIEIEWDEDDGWDLLTIVLPECWGPPSQTGSKTDC